MGFVRNYTNADFETAMETALRNNNMSELIDNTHSVNRLARIQHALKEKTRAYQSSDNIIQIRIDLRKCNKKIEKILDLLAEEESEEMIPTAPVVQPAKTADHTVKAHW